MAAKLTVTLPWLFLSVLIIYNATLDGSADGVKAYIGEWDMSVLKNGEAWSDAAGQIFFTLGATWGAPTAPTTPPPDALRLMWRVRSRA